jgi:HEAT repeat protein
MTRRRWFQGSAIALTVVLLAVYAVPSWRRDTLGRIRGEPVVRGHSLSYWQGLLERGSESDRLVARMSLRKIGAPAVPYLTRCLAREDPSLRIDAAAALAGMAANVALDDAVPALLAALDDPEPDVVANAAAALAYVRGKRAAEVARRLRLLLQAPNDRVRRGAAQALERLEDRGG